MSELRRETSGACDHAAGEDRSATSLFGSYAHWLIRERSQLSAQGLVMRKQMLA